jgi:hypothetical protein
LFLISLFGGLALAIDLLALGDFFEHAIGMEVEQAIGMKVNGRTITKAPAEFGRIATQLVI